MAKRKLNLQNAKIWEELPDVWKVVKRVKPLDLSSGVKKDGIKDKGLLKVVEKHLGDDALRTAMSGLFVDKGAVVGTNANSLICIPLDLDAESGIYSISPKISKKIGEKLYGKINQKYPSYKDILGENDIVVKVDAVKLKTYCQAVMNGKYPNQVTNAVQFKVNKEFNIGINAEMLTDAIDSLMLLGHDELYFSFRTPSRAIYISPNEKTAKTPKEYIGKHPFVLLMPMLIDTDLGARDLDFGTGIDVYFSFEDNEIYNADVRVAKFDKNLSNTELQYIDSDSFDLINKLVPKNATIPVTEYVNVIGSKAFVTNLDYFLEVKDVFVEDGLYEVCNGALKDNDYDPKNFPVFKKDGFQPLGKAETNQFAQRVKQSITFVGVDDLRPITETLCLKIDENNRATLFATDMHSMIISSLSNAKLDKSGTDYLIESPKYLSNVLEVVKDETINLSSSGGRLMVQTDNYNFSMKLLDAKALNYESVLDTGIDSYISFNTSEMILAINSLKGEDAKKNIYFELDDSGYIDLEIGKYDPNTKGFTTEKFLGIKIPCTIGKTKEKFTKDIALLMPINSGNKDSVAFNPKLLKNLLMVGDMDEARLNFNSQKGGSMSQFIVDLRPVVKAKTRETPKVEKKEVEPEMASKEDVMIKIKALKFLADSGDKDAEQKIKILKMLL
jgi:DNA polymerase III sliding clamp (beta) subunit (PCNA family)